MATEATWQRTDATMTMEHYRAMCVRYRDDTATRMQWISRMQLQPVELFADVLAIHFLAILLSLSHYGLTFLHRYMYLMTPHLILERAKYIFK